jgi:hypothetical protein
MPLLLLLLRLLVAVMMRSKSSPDLDLSLLYACIYHATPVGSFVIWVTSRQACGETLFTFGRRRGKRAPFRCSEPH